MTGVKQPCLRRAERRATWFHEDEGVVLPLLDADFRKELELEVSGWSPDMVLGKNALKLTELLHTWVDKVRKDPRGKDLGKDL